MSSLVIHPGYPKAASSWLQDNVWSNRDLGFCAPWAVPGLWGAPADAITRFIDVDDDDFRPIAVREGLQQGLDDAQERGLVPVFSAELLIDHPDGLGGWSERVAQRLSQTVPDARILIIVREQRDAIISAYRHFVSVGGRLSLSKFIGADEFGFPSRVETLRYDRVIGLYDGLFGEESVCVVPFELLKLDAGAFVGHIVEKLGAVVLAGSNPNARPQASNRGWSATRLGLQRRANYLAQPRVGLDQPALWIAAVRASERLERVVPRAVTRSAEQRLKAAVEQIIGERFAPHNRWLGTRTGFDLASFGYALPQGS